MGTIRLVAFDLDGTLTRGDSVCCVIAAGLVTSLACASWNA